MTVHEPACPAFALHSGFIGRVFIGRVFIGRVLIGRGG